MTLQLLTVPDESLLGHAPAGLRLRLASRAGESRVIEVNEAKCSIGTAASCTVRLPEKPSGRRLSPTECVILRGDARTVVRRLSPRVRLNGREFTDAVLHTGDRLAIGSYDIEVLPPPDQIAGPPRERQRVDRVLMAELAAWQSERDRLHAEVEEARAETRRLAADGAMHVARHHQMQNAVAQLQYELDQAWKSLEEDRQQWQVERQQQHDELSEKTAALTAAVQQSARWEAALAKANDRLARQSAEAKAAGARHEEAQAALARLQATLNQQAARFEADRGAWQEERELRLAQSRQMSLTVAAAVEASSRLQDELDRVSERAALHSADDGTRAAAQAAAEQAIAQLRAELADALDKASRSEAELSQVNERMHDMAERLDAQTALCQRTQEALEAAENERAEALEALQEERTHQQAGIDTSAAEQSQTAAELADALDKSSRLEAELSQVKEQLARLKQALDESSTEREKAQSAFDQQCATWQAEHDAQAAELSRKSSDLTAAIDQLSHLSLAFAEANAQVERLTADVDRQTELVQQSQAALEQLREELAQTHAAYEQRIDRDAVEEEAEQQSPSLPAQSERSVEEAASAESGVVDEHDAAMSMQAESAEDAGPAVANGSANAQFTQTDDLLARFSGAEQEVAFQAPSSEAPVTTADLLSRFGLSVEHDAPEALSDEPVPHSHDVPPQPQAATPAQHAGTGAEAHHEEQDSIDAYMAQLMARLGRTMPDPPREEPRTREVIEEMHESEAVEPVADAPLEPKLRDPSEMGRRALPPELSADLSAMREIANINARAAIDTHARGTLIKTWLSKAAVMVLGLVAAGAEAWFALEGNDTASYFIVPSLMVAIFWGWQYLVMSTRLNQSRGELNETEAANSEE